ncbi:alpha/beta fold hydrolase [Acetobacter estunensis]|uniref:Alpha/beta fold hydrolase n=1 Tax=Acetobacter estunensis TaxID=104097 RepID=A0A967BA03_9PROT|nr:alpha/beta hydrolase [Acetobacter estunensis]NHO55069.1 alpha/beta fold hydrolase [Acetobacter estunensis]
MRLSSSSRSEFPVPHPVLSLVDKEQDGRKNLVQRLAAFDVVIVPGLDGSGPRHWQSLWEEFLLRHGVSVQRVEQGDWSRPDLVAWQMALQALVNVCVRPVVIIAHSLGALLTVHCAELSVAGALLVAPADVDEARASDVMRTRGFAPVPQKAVAFPSVLAASDNDEWLSPCRARFLAQRWGAELFPAGRVGHIGNRENLGMWQAGFHALERLLDRIDRERKTEGKHEI